MILDIELPIVPLTAVEQDKLNRLLGRDEVDAEVREANAARLRRIQEALRFRARTSAIELMSPAEACKQILAEWRRTFRPCRGPKERARPDKAQPDYYENSSSRPSRRMTGERGVYMRQRGAVCQMYRGVG